MTEEREIQTVTAADSLTLSAVGLLTEKPRLRGLIGNLQSAIVISIRVVLLPYLSLYFTLSTKVLHMHRNVT